MANRTNFNHKINSKQSFTLVETIVASYILLAGVVSSMTLVYQNINTITYSRNQLIATNLAQEGAELVRNKRDSNFLECVLGSACSGVTLNKEIDLNSNNTAGLAGTNALGASGNTPCDDANGCYVNDIMVSSLSFSACQNASLCRRLMLNSATGVYSYASGAASLFDRRIVMRRKQQRGVSTDGVAVYDWEVASTVTWTDKLLGVKSVVIREVLTPGKLGT